MTKELYQKWCNTAKQWADEYNAEKTDTFIDFLTSKMLVFQIRREHN